VSYATPSSHSSRPQHPPDRQALRKEVQIHAVLKHPNVLEFLGVEEHLKESSKNFVPGLYMVLELGAGGDLFDKIGETSQAAILVDMCMSSFALSFPQLLMSVLTLIWLTFTFLNLLVPW
jgi:serine/threonine protein kinase